MRERLRRLIAEAVDTSIEEVNPESTMANLEGWDSLNHIKIIVALEEQFGVTFNDDEIVTVTSVAAIEAVLNGKGVPA